MNFQVEHDVRKLPFCLLGTVNTDAVPFVTTKMIGFDAATPFVYTAPVEFVIRTGSF